jgi:hypothetical protein
MRCLSERLTSRKFLLALGGAVTILLANLGLIPLEDDGAWHLIAIIMGHAGIEGASDLVFAWRKGHLLDFLDDDEDL